MEHDTNLGDVGFNPWTDALGKESFISDMDLVQTCSAAIQGDINIDEYNKMTTIVGHFESEL